VLLLSLVLQVVCSDSLLALSVYRLRYSYSSLCSLNATLFGERLLLAPGGAFPLPLSMAQRYPVKVCNTLNFAVMSFVLAYGLLKRESSVSLRKAEVDLGREWHATIAFERKWIMIYHRKEKQSTHM
jgi:hypothetical protein